MAKTPLSKTKEQQFGGGGVPACTCAKLKIKAAEVGKTSERAKVPGAKQYTIDLEIQEPASLKGKRVRDWIQVGTADDLQAKRPETWKVQEGGPGRLKRLMVRSGTPISDEEDEWREAMLDNIVYAPLEAYLDDNGTLRNRVGLYFRESDDDCPEVGLADEQPVAGGKKRGAAGAAQEIAKRRAKAAKVEEDEEEEETDDEEETDEEDEDDEEEKKPATKGKKLAAKGKKTTSDDDEDEDDDDED